MSRVGNKNTDIEKIINGILKNCKIKFTRHVRKLPGTPDFAIPSAKIAIFVDGDFWHGYRFPAWRNKVSPFWQDKILKNRQRDRRNFQRLRRMGWQTLRIWQHQAKTKPGMCADLINRLVTKQTTIAPAKARNLPEPIPK